MNILIISLRPVVTPQMLHAVIGQWLNPIIQNKSQVKVVSLVSEDLYNESISLDIPLINPLILMKDYGFEKARKALISENAVTDNSLSILNNLTLSLSNEEEDKVLEQLFKIKLKGYKPDIILSFYGAPEIFMRKIFPNTLCFWLDNGLFSRPPFPHTIYLEPIGKRYNSLNGFMSKYKENFKNIRIEEDEKSILRDFKHELRTVITQHSPINEKILHYKNKFSKLLLLPLSCCVETEFSTDIDLLNAVLEKTPADVGIILTQHDSSQSKCNDAYIAKLQKQYPNLIYFSEINGLIWGSSSLYFLEHVDAIIGLYSTLPLLSLVYDLPVLSLVDGIHEAYQMSTFIDGINSSNYALAKSNDKVLYWYLTHYMLIMNLMVNDPAKQYDFLEKKLMHFNSYGVDFNFFTEHNNLAQICAYVLNHVKAYYFASSHKDEQIVKSLFATKEHKGLVPLHMAALLGKIEEIAFWLSKNISINVSTEDAYTPLHFACEAGHIEVVAFLLEHRAYPNCRNKENETPLHLACKNNHLEIVKLLVEKKAKTTIISASGCTALEYAKEHTEIYDYLSKL